MQTNTSVFALAIVFLVVTSEVSARYHHGLPALKRVRRSNSPQCDEETRFRSFDGQCNNLKNPTWGSVNQPFERIAPAAYQDGMGIPRVNGVDGNPLPLVREVSRKIHHSDNSKDEVTLMVMQWGQYLDHDLTLTAESEDVDGNRIECSCSSSDPLCFNIMVDSQNEDHFTNRACLEFTRSEGTLVLNTSTNTTVREQTNTITSFIDGSQVYGSSKDQADLLRRASVRGSLKVAMNIGGNGPLLPEDETGGCILQADEYCFHAGDSRVNEMPGLAALHTIFVREHNRIARFFREDTSWDDDRIFHETRRIVGAILQHITYAEYLPTVLSPAIMDEFKLHHEECFEYNPDLRPDIINSFATAAFRFGHSQIPEGVNHGNTFISLGNLFSRPFTVFERFDNVTGALGKDMSMKSDRFFARSVTRHLVMGPGLQETDLLSRNLQRGRDHGLPSYNEFRKACNLNPFQSFGNFSADISNVYDSVEDVDLFTGAMLEKRIDESLLGPTFSCILARQFNKLKYGDRFFYTTRDNTTRFTKPQLREIKKITLSKVICLNSENKKVQPNIFLPADNAVNSIVRCEQLPQINLKEWI